MGKLQSVRMLERLSGSSTEKRLTMMSAVSLKPSAILEATFSATWFGL
jgi:hypothetical protein